MTTLDLTRASFGSTSVAARVQTFFFSALHYVSLWNEARLTRKALSKLSDRQLEDIGVIPGDIQNIRAKW